jgi:hypothetical protein
MATVTLARSDAFPVGTTVGIYPAGAQRQGSSTPQPPTASVIASAAVDAAGLLTVTNAGILQGVDYVAAAQVGGVWTYVRARSTLDVADRGSATSGAFAVGQRISTVAAGIIPPGTLIKALSTLASGAVTAVAATDVFTRASHGLKLGDSIMFSGLTGGAGISTTVPYYVVSVPTTGTFKVSVGPPGSTPLDVTTDLTAGTVAGVMAAVTGKKIRVKAFQIANQVATAQAVKLRSGTTDLFAALALPLAIGLPLDAADDGDGPDDFLVETAAGALLAVNLSAATAITGTIVYSLE